MLFLDEPGDDPAVKFRASGRPALGRSELSEFRNTVRSPAIVGDLGFDAETPLPSPPRSRSSNASSDRSMSSYAQDVYAYLSGLNQFHWTVLSVAVVSVGVMCMRGNKI